MIVGGGDLPPDFASDYYLGGAVSGWFDEDRIHVNGRGYAGRFGLQCLRAADLEALDGCG